MYLSITVLFLSSYLPLFVFAQFVPEPNLLPPTNLSQFVNNFISILNSIIPFVAGFGFFGILTGVMKYIGAGGDEEKLGKAKQLIFYGSIGIVVLYSFWGLASIFSRSYFLAI